MTKQKIVVIAGPTACGKTAASVELCRLIGGEVISADSMQVYRHMDIGTAKVTKEESRGIPHFLIDELEPWEDYSAAKFKIKAKSYIEDIAKRGKIPIVVGGTGFYINALLSDNDFGEGEKDHKIRNELTALLNEKGAEYMYEMLKGIDPEYAAAIHPNNIKRVLRGIEYFRETGEKFSHHNNEERKKEYYYDPLIFVLNMPRDLLYDRINRRVDIMLENGLVEEVRKLNDIGVKREAVSMQGLGYKEIEEYLFGEISLDEAVYKLKRDTRHFAKRQLTWFKHQLKDAIWIDVCKYENAQGLGKELAERTGKWLTGQIK